MDFDLNDIFGSFFGGGFSSGRSGRASNAPTRGDDIGARVFISFEEAAFGCKKEISFERTEKCASCGGSGAKKGSKPETCPTCGGSGQVRVNQRTPFGVMQSVRTCDACGGKGKLVKDPCPDCRGNGYVRRKKTLEVSIPAGIDNGQALTLRGQGEPGQRGGPAGDLYIAITVRPSRKFRRDGANLYSEMTISFAQAALGDEVEIETLKGSVKETIAEGTQPGQVIRVRGEGVPSLRNPSQRGDLFVTLKVEVPKRLNERQRMALRLFDEAMGGKASGASRGDNWKKSVKEFFDKFKD